MRCGLERFLCIDREQRQQPQVVSLHASDPRCITTTGVVIMSNQIVSNIEGGKGMRNEPETRGTPLVCPIHGTLEPGWTTCPYCQKEARESTRAGSAAPTQKRAGPPKPRSLNERETQKGAAPGARSQAEDKTVRRGPAPQGRGRGRVAPTERVHRPPELLAWLIMKEGSRIGQVFELDPAGTDIGREPANHIVLDDPKVSAFHAKIKVEEGKQLMVWDLASANGTFVNGEKVTAPVPIKENDAIRVGTTVLVLKTLE